MTSQPHDALFKAAFEHPARAAGLFRHLLPAYLSWTIDWTTLAQEHVDTDTELSFSVQRGDRKVFLLCAMRIFDDHSKQVDDSPLLTFLIIMRHAPDGRTAPQPLLEFFCSPASHVGRAPRIPSIFFLAEDLTSLTDEQLQRLALAPFPALALRSLRDARNAQQFMRNFGEWADASSRVLASPSDAESITQVLRYVTLACEGLRYDDFRLKLREQLPEAERPTMTIAEELMQKGREEGRAEGQVALLVKQLTRKFGELPAEYRARLETATSDLLERYAERLLVVGTLAAVFTDD